MAGVRIVPPRSIIAQQFPLNFNFIDAAYFPSMYFIYICMYTYISLGRYRGQKIMRRHRTPRKIGPRIPLLFDRSGEVYILDNYGRTTLPPAARSRLLRDVFLTRSDNPFVGRVVPNYRGPRDVSRPVLISRQTNEKAAGPFT